MNKIENINAVKTFYELQERGNFPRNMTMKEQDIYYKILHYHNTLSFLGLDDQEIRKILETYLHHTQSMNKICYILQIKHGTSPDMIALRGYLLSSFHVGDNVSKSYIEEKMNEAFIKSNQPQQPCYMIMTYFNILFPNRERSSQERGKFIEIIKTFEDSYYPYL